jgi:hypothetical protein
MRNHNAGKFTGMSASARYFANHPDSRAKKNAYNKKYHSTDERTLYRAALNRANSNDPTNKEGDGKDAAHSKNGTAKQQDRSLNRSFNGKGSRPRYSR